MGVISIRKNSTHNVLKNIHKLIFLLLGDCGTGVSHPIFFIKNKMTMSKERKIIQYAIDEKTYKSLEIQFKREYVYSVVLSKLLAQLKKM